MSVFLFLSTLWDPRVHPLLKDPLIISYEQTTHQDNDNFEKLGVLFHQSPGAEAWSVRCGKLG